MKLSNEIIITAKDSGFAMSEELSELFCDEINEYLADKYGYLNQGWCYEIKISDIMWEKD